MRIRIIPFRSAVRGKRKKKGLVSGLAAYGVFQTGLFKMDNEAGGGRLLYWKAKDKGGPPGGHSGKREKE